MLHWLPELMELLCLCLPLKIAASVEEYFRMETDLCAQKCVCLFIYQFVCLSVDLINILLFPNFGLQGILRSLNGESEQNHAVCQQAGKEKASTRLYKYYNANSSFCISFSSSLTHRGFTLLLQKTHKTNQPKEKPKQKQPPQTN